MIKTKIFSLEFDQQDLNRLEQELFTLSTQGAGINVETAQSLFKTNNPVLSKIYGLIMSKINSEDL